MREPALKIPLSEIKGEYVKGEKEFDTNYLITPDEKKISRVNIWGNVVKKFEGENFTAITIDDFTQTIDANVFENLEILEKIQTGDIIKIIGKIRQGNKGLFVLIEGIQKLSFQEEMNKRLENIIFLKKWKKNTKKKDEKNEDEFFTEASNLKVEKKIIR